MYMPTSQAWLSLEFDRVAGTPLYVVHMNDTTAARPAPRIGRTSTEGALAGICLDDIYRFMDATLPPRYEDARALLRNNPDSQIYVGEATVDTATGHIIVAHIYPQFHVATPASTAASRSPAPEETA